MSRLVFAAFRALGPAATKREIELVAKTIRASRDQEALELFGTGPEPDPDPPFDRGACGAVTEIAERAGAGGLVGLDLYTEVVRPGWSPFPSPGAEARLEDPDTNRNEAA